MVWESRWNGLLWDGAFKVKAALVKTVKCQTQRHFSLYSLSSGQMAREHAWLWHSMGTVKLQDVRLSTCCCCLGNVSCPAVTLACFLEGFQDWLDCVAQCHVT